MPKAGVLYGFRITRIFSFLTSCPPGFSRPGLPGSRHEYKSWWFAHRYGPGVPAPFGCHSRFRANALHLIEEFRLRANRPPRGSNAAQRQGQRSILILIGGLVYCFRLNHVPAPNLRVHLCLTAILVEAVCPSKYMLLLVASRSRTIRYYHV